jgi:hypothetical protein
LVYADVNLLADKIDNTKENTETLIDASKEFAPEVNAEKIKYMLLSGSRNAGQNHDIKISNRFFENVQQFKYFGTTVTNQNLIQKGIKEEMNSGNACYHSVQDLLCSRLLSKGVNIRMNKTIILSVVLYGCETCL